MLSNSETLESGPSQLYLVWRATRVGLLIQIPSVVLGCSILYGVLFFSLPAFLGAFLSVFGLLVRESITWPFKFVGAAFITLVLVPLFFVGGVF